MSAIIYSLTDQGAQLAARLCRLIPNAVHCHRPKPFAEAVAHGFQHADALYFICATGIVVRTLAPLLNNKHEDPAVIVLDEHGRFVIPLIGAHQRGANQLAANLAQQLAGHCVLTSADHYTQAVLVAGLGCVRNCSAQALHDLLTQSCEQAQISPGELTAIASIEQKADEPGLIKLAKDLGLPFVCYPAEFLDDMRSQVSEYSNYVKHQVGSGSVAEAAALRHAQQLTGNKSTLVMRKRKTSSATLAIAQSIPNEGFR